MKVYIMSGIPGSGKSTWIRNNLAHLNPVILSTDQHHFNSDGIYVFKPERLAEFHARTFRDYVKKLVLYPHLFDEDKENNIIVVDNTNIRDFEILPYYRVAEAFGYDCTVVRMYCDPAKAATRNIHGVPATKVAEMAQSFSPLPSWYKVLHVFDADGVVAVNPGPAG
jgi:tRNA uridine 5-carbamoylmethylation protein Kti12